MPGELFHFSTEKWKLIVALKNTKLVSINDTKNVSEIPKTNEDRSLFMKDFLNLLVSR